MSYSNNKPTDQPLRPLFNVLRIRRSDCLYDKKCISSQLGNVICTFVTPYFYSIIAIVFSFLEFRKLKSRSHGKRLKGNDKRKRCAAQKSNTSLNDISTKLRERGRHAMLSFLNSLYTHIG